MIQLTGSCGQYSIFFRLGSLPEFLLQWHGRLRGKIEIYLLQAGQIRYSLTYTPFASPALSSGVAIALPDYKKYSYD
jgi:hypothetical protein